MGAKGTTSMSKRDIAAHIIISFFVGTLTTAGLVFLVMVTDPEDCGARTPLLERHPFAWVFAWPELFTDRFEAIILSNLLLYSALTYFVLYRRSKPIKLP